jgi:hypothetical protein
MFMPYVKVILSGLAAIIIAELAPGSWSVFRALNGSKATGLPAFAGLVAESIFSPTFWVLTVFLFALLFTASQLNNKASRVVFFWVPTVIASCIGLVVAPVCAYLIFRFRNS